MSFKLIGIIKTVNDSVQVSDKFMKRDVIVTDNSSMYPQDICFQLSQDNCIQGDRLQVGDQVEVKFNLRGREWTNQTTGEIRYFNTLEAWNISLLAGAGQSQHHAQQQTTPPAGPPIAAGTPDDDDLPF